MSKVKLITYVPKLHASSVREAICKAGAGIYGNYTNCSYSSEAEERFLPQEGASPSIGKIGQLETVIATRIETHMDKDRLSKVIKALRKAHPYEEPVIYVCDLVDFDY